MWKIVDNSAVAVLQENEYQTNYRIEQLYFKLLVILLVEFTLRFRNNRKTTELNDQIV